MFGSLYGNGNRDYEMDRTYEKIGRQFVNGNTIGFSDLVDVPGLRREIAELKTDIRILQNEMRELQSAARKPMRRK